MDNSKLFSIPHSSGPSSLSSPRNSDESLTTQANLFFSPGYLMAFYKVRIFKFKILKFIRLSLFSRIRISNFFIDIIMNKTPEEGPTEKKHLLGAEGTNLHGQEEQKTSAKQVSSSSQPWSIANTVFIRLFQPITLVE